MVAGPSSTDGSPHSGWRFQEFVTGSDRRTTEKDSNRETFRTAQMGS